MVHTNKNFFSIYWEPYFTSSLFILNNFLQDHVHWLEWFHISGKSMHSHIPKISPSMVDFQSAQVIGGTAIQLLIKVHGKWWCQRLDHLVIERAICNTCTDTRAIKKNLFELKIVLAKITLEVIIIFWLISFNVLTRVT